MKNKINRLENENKCLNFSLIYKFLFFISLTLCYHCERFETSVSLQVKAAFIILLRFIIYSTTTTTTKQIYNKRIGLAVDSRLPAHGGSQPGQNNIPVELEKLLRQFIYIYIYIKSNRQKLACHYIKK